MAQTNDYKVIGDTWIEGTDYCIMTEKGQKRFDSNELKEYNAEVAKVNKWLEENDEGNNT